MSYASGLHGREAMAARVQTASVLALIVVLLVSSGVGVHADDPPKPEPTDKEILVQGAPVTKRLAIILDASGSMQGAPLAQATREIATILSLFPDDGYFKVFVFAGGLTATYDGASAGLRCGNDDLSEADERGWIKLPNLAVFEKAIAWVGSLRGEGGTNPIEAVKIACLEAPLGDLCLLMVTDGEFDQPSIVVPFLDPEDEPDPTLKTSEIVIATAKAAKLPCSAEDSLDDAPKGVVIHTIRVGSELLDGRETCVAIAKATGGTCVSLAQTRTGH